MSRYDAETVAVAFGYLLLTNQEMDEFPLHRNDTGVIMIPQLSTMSAKFMEKETSAHSPLQRVDRIPAHDRLSTASARTRFIAEDHM